MSNHHGYDYTFISGSNLNREIDQIKDSPDRSDPKKYNLPMTEKKSGNADYTKNQNDLNLSPSHQFRMMSYVYNPKLNAWDK